MKNERSRVIGIYATRSTDICNRNGCCGDRMVCTSFDRVKNGDDKRTSK